MTTNLGGYPHDAILDLSAPEVFHANKYLFKLAHGQVLNHLATTMFRLHGIAVDTFSEEMPTHTSMTLTSHFTHDDMETGFVVHFSFDSERVVASVYRDDKPLEECTWRTGIDASEFIRLARQMELDEFIKSLSILVMSVAENLMGWNSRPNLAHRIESTTKRLIEVKDVHMRSDLYKLLVIHHAGGQELLLVLADDASSTCAKLNGSSVYYNSPLNYGPIMDTRNRH